MRREYNFSTGKRNPYSSRLKQQVTMRIDGSTVAYFKELATSTGIPYQSLINLYLRECATTQKKLDLRWKVQRTG